MMWNKFFFFLCVGVFFFILAYFLGPVLTPFLMGILLAYLVNPLVLFLMRWNIPRVLAVVLVFLFLTLIMLSTILLLIPLIQKQINTLIQMIPRMIEWFQQSFLPYVTKHMSASEEDMINVPLIKKTLSENWTTAGSYLGILLNTIVHSGFLILSWLMNLILIPVVTFYLLCDWERLLQSVKNILPRQAAPTIISLSKECDQVLGAFFRGQLLVMLFIAIFYSVGLSIIGLDIGIVLGIILGMISIVPYLGVVIGITSASIAAYVQFGNLQP
ncbi:MAG TPA: AI-2E family transporter, partial [Gammaproteobacteria bacterium]|nr:AI-2E family transporter [Gammaproteobacteria bacterium]